MILGSPSRLGSPDRRTEIHRPRETTLLPFFAAMFGLPAAIVLTAILLARPDRDES